MPALGPEQLSNEELDLLVAYIESLESDGGHMEPSAVPLDAEVAMHHWMALAALADDDEDEATHHVGHVIEIVEDDEHRHRMEAVLVSIEAGAHHDAEHEIEEMLTGIAEPALSTGELQLQLALTAVLIGDAPEAIHHLEHFTVDADEHERETAQGLLEQIDAGALEATEQGIIELLESIEHQQHRHE